MKKVALINLVGCYRRNLDRIKVENYFKTNGWITVESPEESDVIILFTCGVSEFLEDESIKKIKALEQLKKRLIVTGCLPGINLKKVRKVFDGEVVSTKNLEIIHELIGGKYSFDDIEDGNVIEESKTRVLWPIFRNKMMEVKEYLSKFFENRKLFYVRVQDGCRGNCSYCAIKKAIGEVRSKSLDKCLKEVGGGISAGYKYMVVGGDDVGAYGLDIKSSFVKLISGVLGIKGDFKLIVYDLNPIWFLKYINDLKKIVKDERLIRMHLLVQSGSTRVLKMMNRSMELEKIAEGMKALRKINPKLEFYTCYLMGFPGETEKDFVDSLEFIKKAGFDQVSLYTFSMRPETEASKYEKVALSEETKSDRLQRAVSFFKNSGIEAWYELDDLMNKGVKEFEQ